MGLATILLILFGLFVFGMCVLLILENRRPQSTLAWLMVFVFLPGVGVLTYILFGRDWKAFSRQRRLLMQDLEGSATPLVLNLLARQDAEIARLESANPGYGKLMSLVRRNSQSGLTMRNEVQVQQDASEFYPSLIADIKAARHSIHLQYFIWRADEFTEELRELLAEKVKAGVKVRLLYDPVGSRSLFNWPYIRRMRAAGIEMRPTSPLYHLHTISYRNHRKITVIDGSIGYTGGMNIGQEHLDGGGGFESWRDTQLRIVGEGVALLQAVFMVDWYNAARENLFSKTYFPDYGGHPNEAEKQGVPVQMFTSGPDSQWAAIRQLYALMIVTAQRHVILQSPYFILDAGLAETLKSAALAGIDIRVMLSARESGNPISTWAANTYVHEVAQAGVRVYLYQKGYLHAKTISVDSGVCSVGSANIDIRSFHINYELNAVLYSKRIAAELERAFARDLEHCIEFDSNEYQIRSPASRFRDSAARLFSPLL